MPTYADQSQPKQARSIFGWRRQAQANQPTALSVVETKPTKGSSATEHAAKPGSSIEGSTVHAGSRISPFSGRTADRPPAATAAKPPAIAQKLDTARQSDAELPTLSRPLSIPIPRAQSPRSTAESTIALAPPKSLDIGQGKLNSEPTRFPTMKQAATTPTPPASETEAYELPSRFALRPARVVADAAPQESRPTSARANADQRPMVDDEQLPTLGKSLTPPTPIAAKLQNNQLSTPPEADAGASSSANPPTTTSSVELAAATSRVGVIKPFPEAVAKSSSSPPPPAPVGTFAAAKSLATDRAAQAALEVDGLAFCTQVLGFGDIEKMPATQIVAGRPVLIYCEVRNFASNAKDGGFETVLNSQLSLENRQGAVVSRVDFDPIVDRCQTKRTDFYCHYTFALPKSLSPGGYVLRLKIKDAASGQQAECSLPFEVAVSKDVEASAAPERAKQQ